MPAFRPLHALVLHPKKADLEATAWLRDCVATPFEGALSELPLTELPLCREVNPTKTQFSGTPLQIETDLPGTGRRLRLVVMRDLSALALISSPAPSGWSVLPACLALPSSSVDAAAAETPYLERGETCVDLFLQARPDGLRWNARRPQALPGHAQALDDDIVTELLCKDLVDRAREILAAPPVCDPRHHATPPAGTRHAPFAPWPNPEAFPRPLARLRRAIEAALILEVIDADLKRAEASIYPFLPETPWQVVDTGKIVQAPPSKGLSRALRRIATDPTLDLPPALMAGPVNRSITRVSVYREDISAHQVLRARATLRGLTSATDLSALKSPGRTATDTDPSVVPTATP